MLHDGHSLSAVSASPQGNQGGSTHGSTHVFEDSYVFEIYSFNDLELE